MKQIVLATQNPHKVEEMKAIFSGLEIEFLSLADFENIEPAVEDGITFKENAIKKARHVALQAKKYTLADDSGLEVEALGGRPGIYSSRYAPDNPGRIRRLLSEMEEVPDEKRAARFVCCMALSDPEGKVTTETGYCHGVIAYEPAGTGGFGYDPIFYLPGINKTMAQLTPEEKNQISHRSEAARLMKPIIKQYPSLID